MLVVSLVSDNNLAIARKGITTGDQGFAHGWNLTRKDVATRKMLVQNDWKVSTATDKISQCQLTERS